MVNCNICGNKHFEHGPNGRVSGTGLLPRCSTCYSLERHRSLRECLLRFPSDMLVWRRAIQFAPDGSLEPAWFRTYEESKYGGPNSLDLQHIDRPADSYDFISLSSVLEFVPNDRMGFSELSRIASSTAIIHATFLPSPTSGVTEHYQEPHGAFGRFHRYGLDLGDSLGVKLSGFSIVAVDAVDPVTQDQGRIHFFCKQTQDACLLANLFETVSPALTAYRDIIAE